MQSLLILGRQPAIGLAELESIFGADKLTPVGKSAVLLDVPAKDVPFRRLGGSLKLAKLLTDLPGTSWPSLVKYIDKTLPDHLANLPDGKLKFGLSAYGLPVSTNDINRAGLKIKKTIKAAGRSVRVVPNNEPALSSAQVIHNQMTSALGIELLLVADGSKTWLAQTFAEQDIAAYTARDQARPKRDSRVGMLPPKLAQIIINLANPAANATVLDPFCGTGVILQEALLMGFGAFGTDIDQRMIDYTRENVIEWLPKHFASVDLLPRGFEKGDATTMTWGDYPKYNFGSIAAETYLGRPFSSQPDSKTLHEVVQDVSLIHKRFLQNVARQTEPGFRLALAVPAWKTPNGFVHLKTLDNLANLGYTRMEFVHAGQADMIYYREGQVVGRELVVLIRK